MTVTEKIARCKVAAAQDLHAIMQGRAVIRDPLIFTVEVAAALWAPIRLGGFSHLLAALPSKFAGLAFAAIGVGVLLPSAIMAVACVNIIGRHIYREFIDPAATDARQAGAAKLASLAAKTGALAFFMLVPVSHALQFLLLASLWMAQALPAILRGLHARMLNGRAASRRAKFPALHGTATASDLQRAHRARGPAIYYFT